MTTDAETDAEKYHRHRRDVAERKAAQSRAGRDIGKLPPPEDPERRQRAHDSFLAHCETYHAEAFTLDWSEDHLAVIQDIDQAGRKGLLKAFAMARGSGKTTLSEIACEWVLLHKLRRFAMLVGADESAAAMNLASIRTTLETNELLLADFPEVCLPIVAMEGVAQRRLLCEGEAVTLRLTGNAIELPYIKGTIAQGGVLRVGGITGRIRGAKAKLPSGDTIRPDFVMIDDPQTDESARSPSQVAQRERIVAGAILGLAGPAKKIAGIMPCTVIRPDDMADRILDRKLHPEWNGQRTSMLRSMPSDAAMQLWSEYADTLHDCLRDTGDIEPATAYYLQHREAMDDGAEASWEARYNEDEASAIQHAMNLYLRDRAAFQAEYQNQPAADDSKGSVPLVSSKDLSERVNGLRRNEVPLGHDIVTGFIDVQQACLWWMTCSWRADFTGAVINYGTWPEQGRKYFTLREVSKTLQKAKPGAGLEGAIHNGLQSLCTDLFEQPAVREDEVPMAPRLVLVDANWGQSTEVVREFCRRSRWAGTVMPYHGRFIGATSRQIAEYAKRKGERKGHHWKSSVISRLLHVLADVNFWKSMVHERLAVPFGDIGNLSMFGDERDHRLLRDHLLAETRTRVTANNRTVDEWKLPPNKPDNHWLDCLVGCAVAASVMGAELPAWRNLQPRKKARRRRGRVREMD